MPPAAGCTSLCRCDRQICPFVAVLLAACYPETSSRCSMGLDFLLYSVECLAVHSSEDSGVGFSSSLLWIKRLWMTCRNICQRTQGEGSASKYACHTSLTAWWHPQTPQRKQTVDSWKLPSDIRRDIVTGVHPCSHMHITPTLKHAYHMCVHTYTHTQTLINNFTVLKRKLLLESLFSIFLGGHWEVRVWDRMFILWFIF